MKAGFLVTAMVSLVATHVVAQEMRPLAELMQDAASPYATTRCAGLYQSTMEWTGFERMGEATWKQTDSIRESLIMFSVFQSQQISGGTLPDVTETVLRDVRNIANLYIGRMERNYALEGQAFGSDEIIRSDLELCGAIAGALQ